MLAGSALVMIMTPGLGFFYAGLVGEETAANTIMMSMVSVALVSVQWLFFGYSFAFGPGTPGFGTFEWAAFLGVGEAPSGAYGSAIPHLVYAIFQCMFAQITPALISGGLIGRMKFSAFCVFIFIWTTVIYDALAHWVWSIQCDPVTFAPAALGWLGVMGALDFAGGTVIHISSGFSALSASMILGRRANHSEKLKPHNVPMVVLGASLLWFGWFGFNSASAGAASGVAANAFVTTHFATATGFLTWMFFDAIFAKSWSAVGGSAGAVAGLVAITPGCGFVSPWASIFFGFVPVCFCYGAVKLKERLGYDDTLDAFGVHGVGGAVGALLTGLFADPSINPPFAGAFYGNPRQFGIQLLAVVVSSSYAFFGTAIILYGLKFTMGIRADPEAEAAGLDSSMHGGESYVSKSKEVTVQ